MIVLGIDPGSRKTGYAILETNRNNKTVLDYGTITLTDLKSMPEKLVRIFERVGELFEKYSIETVAVEAGFYGKNAQSAYKLGYARSAAVLAAALKSVEVVEYSPRKVKQAVTGNGNASKSQVKYMVKNLLRLSGTNSMREDEADACAVAICHTQNSSPKDPSDCGKARYKSWKDFVEKNKPLIVRSTVANRRK
ncbi:MAG: crossover junction endodeoxyribonuclease RuvC [Bacteroidetes bacterium]|nr:crossover junction endodeoxyribonuclease RuvC [Bacteroidota bacterium]MCL5738091.1 crossover junction endodeoxyribonuclease RuvC [Bacteroidota bacterium]